MSFKTIPLFALIAFIASCSTAPEFKRDNANDPKSDSYILKPPSGANYQLDESGNVVLFWEDKSDFESGYRVFKSLGENGEFTLLAELDKKSDSFIDSSKVFAYPTKYHIVSFYNQNVSDTLTIDIDFGKVSALNAEFSDDYEEIKFSWNDNVFEADGFILYSKIDSTSESKFITTFPSSPKHNTIQTPKIGYIHEYSLTPFKIFEADTTTLQKSDSSIIKLGPKDLDLNLTTVDSLQITWKDLSDSEEHFLITLTDHSGTESFEVEKNNTTYTIHRAFLKDEEVVVTLKGVYNSFSSEYITKDFKMSLQPPSIKRFDYRVSDDATIVIISDSTQTRREKKIYRKTNNSGFVEIGTVAKGDSVFIDNSLDKSNIYSYSVSAPLSSTSPNKSIRFTNILTPINKVESRKRTSFNTSFLAHNPEKNILAYLTTDDQWVLYVVDYINGTTSKEISLESRMLNITIDNDVNTIVASSLVDKNKMYIIDINSELVDSLSFGTSDILELNFSGTSNNVFALIQKPDENIELISIDLEAKTTELLETLNTKDRSIKLHINDAKTKLVVKYTVEGSLEGTFIYRFYNLTETGIEFYNEQTTVENLNSTFTFSANLDTTIIATKNENELIMYDFNSQSNVFKGSFSISDNYFFNSTTLLNNGTFYLQDEQSAFVVDTKLSGNKISQQLDFSGIPIAGEVLWNNESNYLIDFRRSFDPNIMSYYTVLIVEQGWVEVIDN